MCIRDSFLSFFLFLPEEVGDLSATWYCIALFNRLSLYTFPQVGPACRNMNFTRTWNSLATIIETASCNWFTCSIRPVKPLWTCVTPKKFKGGFSSLSSHVVFKPNRSCVWPTCLFFFLLPNYVAFEERILSQYYFRWVQSEGKPANLVGSPTLLKPSYPSGILGLELARVGGIITKLICHCLCVLVLLFIYLFIFLQGNNSEGVE